jgi:nitrite reductase/ring-hydroxylating ferredoxin subunit
MITVPMPIDKETGKQRVPLAGIPNPGALGITPRDQPHAPEIVILRHGMIVRAYVNQCPQDNSPLEIAAEERDFEKQIAPATVRSRNGTEYRLEDGCCISDPDTNLRLKPVPILFDSTWITLP